MLPRQDVSAWWTECQGHPEPGSLVDLSNVVVRFHDG